MISERSLKLWRRHSLKRLQKNELVTTFEHSKELHERILKLTQELLDQHLIRKE